jgi:hypothetical protein
LRREFGCKLLDLPVDQTRKSGGWRDSAKFPVNFPVSREFGAETGSQLTASSARQSGVCRPLRGDKSSAFREVQKLGS